MKFVSTEFLRIMRMAISATSPFLLISLFTLFIINCNGKADESSDKKVHIVYMGDLPKGDFSAVEQHKRMLHTSLGSNRAEESWLYSYTRSFNGFVAKLTDEERHRISRLKGVVSVFPNTKYKLQTTRSWDFMGFHRNVERSQTESNIIIGILDSGIWPESRSFQDAGFGPPPTKWKGTCQSSSNFTCNNKIVGAKYYHTEGNITHPDIPSPRDTSGHGTHTASIAAGGVVSGANFYGLRAGTARGGVPSARIAVYKVCWSDDCPGSDILAAFDDAIADGVDIISISIGSQEPDDYTEDAISIGAFHAMKHGILTSAGAGNEGPLFGTTSNNSPWVLTVGASSIDRKFVSKVKLGNHKTYKGVAINTFTLKEENYPLVYGGNVPNTALNFNESQSKWCDTDSLDPKKVKGTIVLCFSVNGIESAYGAITARASGVIYYNTGYRDDASTYPIPASVLGEHDGNKVFDYINKTRNPRATIFKSIEDHEKGSPFVVSFSSRGPNYMTEQILKPDLTAPGVDILAAWSEATTVTGVAQDKRVVQYNIKSGTSMACPHASAAAAYVKSFHPTWSPAAIKSALMTTATHVKTESNYSDFARGSGNIDPVKAISPGLVYDIREVDYVRFLCGQGYNGTRLQLITGDKTDCRAAGKSTSVYDLNYPSFVAYGVLIGHNNVSANTVFHRTVTNVGCPSSTYKAVVKAAPGMRIRVRPNRLSFTSVGEKKSFVVIVNATVLGTDLSGSLVWDDGVHQVRSPVVAF